MATTPGLYLGGAMRLDGSGACSPLHVPAHHLVTHGVVVGMTGSGKTGLVTVMVEEALRAGIPVLAFDVKGDLPNLLLAFPSFAPELVEPWAASMADGLPHRLGIGHGDCPGPPAWSRSMAISRMRSR